MCDCGSMTVISASARRSFFCSRRAVYMPTYPPPTTTILWLRAIPLMFPPSRGVHLPPGSEPCNDSEPQFGRLGGRPQHGLQHGRGEPSGEGVLLADVVAAEQRQRAAHTGQIDPHAVAE